MTETRFHGKDFDYVVQIPALSEVIEQDNTDVFVLGPVTGSAGHDMDHPERCKCFPVIWCYNGENGKVDMILIEHKWEM